VWKRYIIWKLWESQFLGKYLRIFRYKFIYSAISIRRIFSSQVIFMKLKIMKNKYFSKNYFPKELNGNLTQIKPAKINRSNVEHKVVLILSFQLISNIFHILLHIFWRAAIWLKCMVFPEILGEWSSLFSCSYQVHRLRNLRKVMCYSLNSILDLNQW
jgi:hypothetical protein